MELKRFSRIVHTFTKVACELQVRISMFFGFGLLNFSLSFKRFLFVLFFLWKGRLPLLRLMTIN